MLLKAYWVLPITAEPLEDGAVVVKGDTIVDVGSYKDLSAEYPDEEVKDFGQSVLLPGFVDLHTHLEFSVFRGVCDDLDFSRWKLQLAEKSSLLAAEDWRLSAELGAVEALQSGITTIADISASGTNISAAVKGGLRGRIYYEITGMDKTKIRPILAAAEETIKEWRRRGDNGLIQIGLSPYSPYNVTPLLYKAVQEWAVADDLPVCTHLAGSPDEYNFVKYGSSLLAGRYREMMGWQDLLWQPTGVSPVKYLEQWDVFDSDILAIHCVHVDRADLDILEKYDVAVAHCPKCNAKLGMGIAPLKEFRARELRLGLGTDSPASSNTMDILDEMRMALMLQRGVTESAEESSAQDFVRMATLGGAEALRMDKEIGSLDKGKKADIIAVDLSHAHQSLAINPYAAMVYTANQEDVIFSMINGRVVFADNQVKTLNESEIVGLSETIRQKLL